MIVQETILIKRQERHSTLLQSKSFRKEMVREIQKTQKIASLMEKKESL
jgi:hypothetical protein